MNELDEILIEQYNSLKRRKKIIKRMKKVMPHEKQLIDGDISLDKQIQFIETYISSIELLKKKCKKKKENIDILERSFIYEAYKNMFYYTFFTYKNFSDLISQYWSNFNKRG